MARTPRTARHGGRGKGKVRGRANALRTIGEAAEMTGVSASTLRVWERDGLLKPVRTGSGRRLWSEQDITRIRQIRHLRRVQKLNSPAIRRLLGAPGRGKDANAAPRDGEDLGRRLRALRQRRRLTLRAVAARTGLSISFLSSVELGHSGVSVTALERILRGLDALFVDLQGNDRGPVDGPRRLVRASERRTFETRAGVRIDQLTAAAAVMEVHLFQIDRGASSEGAYRHDGEEFIHVLRGTLEIVLDEEELYELRAGDTLYFPSTLRHRWRNRGRRATVALWVNTPPTF